MPCCSFPPTIIPWMYSIPQMNFSELLIVPIFCVQSWYNSSQTAMPSTQNRSWLDRQQHISTYSSFLPLDPYRRHPWSFMTLFSNKSLFAAHCPYLIINTHSTWRKEETSFSNDDRSWSKISSSLSGVKVSRPCSITFKKQPSRNVHT
jgi:hypothetical protein